MSRVATSDINLGPLTKPFVAPTQCQSVTLASGSSSTGFSPVMYTASSCYPSGKYLGSEYTSRTLIPYEYHDEHFYYSPGVCPSKWATASVWTGYWETSVACCQPGFTFKRSAAGTATGNSVGRCMTELKTTMVITSTQTVGVQRRATPTALQPDCAVPCVTSAIVAVGCAPTDVACHCIRIAAIQTAVTPCVIANCSANEVQLTAQYFNQACSDYSLTATATVPKTMTTVSTSNPNTIGTTTANQSSVMQAVSTYMYVIWADPVHIRFQATDFVPVFTPIPSHSYTTPSPSTTGSSQGSSVSTIAIVLGIVGFVFLFIIAPAIGCSVMEKRKKRAAPADARVASDDVPPPAYTPVDQEEPQDPAPEYVDHEVLRPAVCVPALVVVDQRQDTVVEPVEPELDDAQAPAPPEVEMDIHPSSPSSIPMLVVRRDRVITDPPAIPMELAIVAPLLGGSENAGSGK